MAILAIFFLAKVCFDFNLSIERQDGDKEYGLITRLPCNNPSLSIFKESLKAIFVISGSSVIEFTRYAMFPRVCGSPVLWAGLFIVVR